MLLQLFQPGGILNKYVELITFFEGSPGHRVERLFPEGVVEVIVDLTETPKFIYDNTTLQPVQTFKTAWISGMRKSFISISALPNSSMFVVRFRSGMSRPILQLPLTEIEDRVVDADRILPGVRELRERLLELSSPAGKFRIMEEYLLKRLSESREIHPAIAAALNTVVHAPTANAIGPIVKASGFSHKHFTALFKQDVGITPKHLVRVLRFQAAVRAIECHHPVQWTQLAHHCGYYDQAHFINDFRKFSGFTPTEYVRMKGDTINYIPVA